MIGATNPLKDVLIGTCLAWTLFLGVIHLERLHYNLGKIAEAIREQHGAADAKTPVAAEREQRDQDNRALEATK